MAWRGDGTFCWLVPLNAPLSLDSRCAVALLGFSAAGSGAHAPLVLPIALCLIWFRRVRRSDPLLGEASVVGQCVVDLGFWFSVIWCVEQGFALSSMYGPFSLWITAELSV